MLRWPNLTFKLVISGRLQLAHPRFNAFISTKFFPSTGQSLRVCPNESSTATSRDSAGCWRWASDCLARYPHKRRKRAEGATPGAVTVSNAYIYWWPSRPSKASQTNYNRCENGMKALRGMFYVTKSARALRLWLAYFSRVLWFSLLTFKQIALLQILVPVERYRQLRRQFMEVKTRQRKLHEKVKKLKAKNEPAHALLKYDQLYYQFRIFWIGGRKLEAEHKEYEKTREEFKKTALAKFNKMKTKWVASEKLVCVHLPLVSHAALQRQ